MTVTATPPPNTNPTVTVTANPASIAAGSASTLMIATTNATSGHCCRHGRQQLHSAIDERQWHTGRQPGCDDDLYRYRDRSHGHHACNGDGNRNRNRSASATAGADRDHHG